MPPSSIHHDLLAYPPKPDSAVVYLGPTSRRRRKTRRREEQPNHRANHSVGLDTGRPRRAVGRLRDREPSRPRAFATEGRVVATDDELHVRVGERVIADLDAADGNRSLRTPKLAGKRRLIPNLDVELASWWTRPWRTGVRAPSMVAVRAPSCGTGSPLVRTACAVPAGSPTRTAASPPTSCPTSSPRTTRRRGRTSQHSSHPSRVMEDTKLRFALVLGSIPVRTHGGCE